jgi:hypothetical protein
MYIYIYLVLSTILPFSPLLAPRSELGCRPSAVQPPAAPEPPEQVALIPGFSGHVIYIYIYTYIYIYILYIYMCVCAYVYCVIVNIACISLSITFSKSSAKLRASENQPLHQGYVYVFFKPPAENHLVFHMFLDNTPRDMVIIKWLHQNKSGYECILMGHRIMIE